VNSSRYNKNQYSNVAAACFFIIFFCFGTFTIKDYGISIDEEFQRSSGFYWLNYLLNFTPFTDLNAQVAEKYIITSDFFRPDIISFYGIIFDVPLAFLEVILNIEETKNYFHLRHYFNFLIFFVSAIYFYKLINDRFSNAHINLIGTLFYVLSPRIYGSSFYNNKDILFLSLLTITFYYAFKCLSKFSYKNLIIFSLLSAFCTSTRIIGIFIPISFTIIFFFLVFTNWKRIDYVIKIIFYLLLYCVFLIMHWPYLWESPISNFTLFLSSTSDYLIKIKLFFSGDYISSNNLPYSYIPIWIGITTPFIHLFFFILGFIFFFLRLFKRFLKIDNSKVYNNLWRGLKEKKDFYIFLYFFPIIVYLISFNVTLYNGWRHIYFLNIFLVYFATYGYYILISNTIFKRKKIFIKLFTYTFLIFVIFKMFIYHPYQNIYFNSFIFNNYKNKFDVDYQGLSGLNFLNLILSLEKNNNKINLGVASFYALERSMSLLNEEDKKRFNFVGQEYKRADYIYTNNISEVDKNNNDKYNIPTNFEQIHQLVVDGVIIYRVYKNNSKL
jgi:hypothetical protein